MTAVKKTVLGTESFTGVAGALAAGYTQQAPNGGTVNKDGSGHGTASAINDCFAMDTAHTYKSNQYSKETTVTTAGAAFSSPEPAVRMSGTGAGTNCVFAAWDNGNRDTAKYVNGTGSDIASVVDGNVAGDVIEIWALENTFILVKNGVEISSVVDTSLTVGAAGPGLDNTGAITIDDWEGGNLDWIAGSQAPMALQQRMR